MNSLFKRVFLLSDLEVASELDHLRLSHSMLIAILSVMSVVLAAIIIAANVNWIPEATANYTPVYISFLTVAGLTLALMKARSQRLRLFVIRCCALFPLFAIYVIYENGYLPLTFAPVTLFITLLLLPRPLRVPMSIGVIICWTIALWHSPVQEAQPYAIRLLAVSAMLIWPISTLLKYQSTRDQVSITAISQLFLSFVILSIPLMLVSTDSQILLILTVDTVIILFIGLVNRIRTPFSIMLKRLFTLVITGLYFLGVVNAGFVGAMILPAVCLALYLALPKGEAAFMSAAALIMGVYGYFSHPPTAFDPVPLFARWAMLSMVFISALHLFVDTCEKRDQKSLQVNDSIPARTYLSIVLLASLGAALFIWTINQGFSEQLKTAPINTDALNHLVLNAFGWLFITWVFSSFALTLFKLRLNEDSLRLALTKEQSASTALRENRERQLRMFAVISHELRTPISAIKMIQDDIGLEYASPQGKELCETTKSVLAVLEDLRLIMQPDDSKTITFTNESPFRVLEKSVNTIKYLFTEHNLTPHISGNTDSNIRCFLAEQTLRQIIINLVKNAAIHANATDLWVNISAQPLEMDRLRLQLTIEDNGRGIQGDKRNALFQPFSRGQTDADGTGLGLYIVKQLADSISADFAYFDSPYGGAGFKLSLCVELSKNIEVRPDPNTELRNELNGLRILLVEDQITLLLLSTKLLEKQGANVVGVMDGIEALTAVSNNEVPFDLVITDLNMPNMNGIVLSETLRDKGFNNPIIALTAAVGGVETDRLIAAGVDSVLAKPISVGALNQEISKLSLSTL